MPKKEEEHEFGERRGDTFWNGQQWVPVHDENENVPMLDMPCPECGKPLNEKSTGCESHPV